MSKVLVIGCGLTGSTLAYLHNKVGDNVIVIEKKTHTAGTAYSKKVEGIHVHAYGAHIFHTDNEEVWDFINKFSDFNNYTHEVKSRCNGNLYSLPINLNTFYEFFGIDDASLITDEHLEQIRKNLYYGYSSKQWGVDVSEIDKSVFERLPIRKIRDNRYFSDKYQGIPIEGYTNAVEKMLRGCDVILNSKVNQRFDFSKFDIIYNTSPIDEFFDFYFGSLPYRSLIFKEEIYQKEHYQQFAVINEADIRVPYTRVIEHKYFNDPGCDYTIITKEYPTEFNLYNKYVELAKLKFPNMVFCGRLGAFKYLDMDDAISEAIILFNKWFKN